jgi:hypothetical protein
MKKAQVQQIMIFVIGLVVISLILLFGYSTLTIMDEDRCEIQAIQFGTNLQQSLEKNNAWGINEVVNLKTPCNTKMICFVDRKIILNPVTAGNYLSPDLTLAQGRIINASVQSNKDSQGDQTNVFIITGEGNVEPVDRYSSANAAIQVLEGSSTTVSSTCVQAQNDMISVRMQGTGKVVRIVSSS